MSADVLEFEVATLDLPRDCRVPDFLIHDGHWLGDATALRGIVLPGSDALLAGGLLEMGARCVYLGAAALRDGELVTALARTHGAQHVGVFIDVARMETSWSLDVRSNADFKTVTPSIGEPAWEILLPAGARSGTLAHWWLAAMFERGAASAIVRVDMQDDTDLNLCATLMEACGEEQLWFAPRSPAGNDFSDWVRWGKVRRLAVPFAMLDGNADLRALAAAEGATA